MIFSHEHNFLFVHIPKVAGTSIQKALQPYAPVKPKDRVSKLRSRVNLVNRNKPIYFPVHASWDYAQKRLGAELYNKMFKFAFVRNPWDRLVSSYHYILENSSHKRHGKINALDSFAAYVEYEIRRNKFLQCGMVTSCGDLKVDYIGKFENLEKDFRYVCERIGVEYNLPHVNQSPHTKYKDFYDDRLVDIVAKHWSNEIRLFDYSF